MGYAGVIAPVLGIGSALGFGSAFLKFRNIVGVMPFLIIGKYISNYIITIFYLEITSIFIITTVQFYYYHKRAGICFCVFTSVKWSIIILSYRHLKKEITIYLFLGLNVSFN